MQYQRFGDRVQIRIPSGEPLLANLLRFLASEGIGYATLTGLGALRQATVSYWNATTQQYEAHDIDEQVELVSLIGNVSIKDDAPFVHAHVTLGRSDLSILGGHFNEAVVHPNVEIWLRPEDAAVGRVLDESCGLYLMDLRERL
jgi:hypothetical protein